jgi:hypothetical protein
MEDGIQGTLQGTLKDAKAVMMVPIGATGFTSACQEYKRMEVMMELQD